MPRKPRFYVPGIPVHVVQRGHNKDPAFFDDLDYHEYLRCLKRAADTEECEVHAYVLMTNHVHLLLSPARSDSIGRIFQSLGRHYVRYINDAYQKRGALWEGRYKSHLVQSQTYFLACMRYIELNPVRASMVTHPAQYRWSSYAANALGVSNPVIRAHSEYLALGNSLANCCASYQELFEHQINEDQLMLFRRALQTGTPLGNEKFKAQIEKTLGRHVGLMRQGRPRKERE